MVPENKRITLRPWSGPSAFTGKTMDEYADELSGPAQHGEWPEWLTRAAVSICRSYGIKGLCDPAYIANVINNSRLGYDGDDRQQPSFLVHPAAPGGPDEFHCRVCLTPIKPIFGGKFIHTETGAVAAPGAR